MTNNDTVEIRNKLEKWRELFSPGEKQFSFIGYEHLYVNTDELLVYDSYAPAGFDREICGWKNYKTLWEKYVPIDFPNWRIIYLGITHIEVHGDWAWSTVTFVGRGIKDGKEYTGGQHGTHIWQRINEEWRIVHEHLTSVTFTAKKVLRITCWDAPLTMLQRRIHGRLERRLPYLPYADDRPSSVERRKI